MAIIKLKTKRTVAVSDIVKRHPDGIYCDTDKQYAELANKIYDMVYDQWTFMEDREIKHASKNFNIPSRDIFNAYMALQPVDIQIANVIPYVGKENASAASALLYNVAGRGRFMNNLRKNFDQVLKDIMKKL